MTAPRAWLCLLALGAAAATAPLLGMAGCGDESSSAEPTVTTQVGASGGTTSQTTGGGGLDGGPSDASLGGAGGSGGAPPDAADAASPLCEPEGYQLSYLPPPMLPHLQPGEQVDCTAEPFYERPVGTTVLAWHGSHFLLLNDGNEVHSWNIDLPRQPDSRGHSVWNIPPPGDVDTPFDDLDVCDDCRFGAATFRNAQVLFDMGEGPAPGFGERNTIGATDASAATFSHGGTQYLIATHLGDGCQAGLFLFDSIAAPTQIGCAPVIDPVWIPPTRALVVPGPTGDFLYLANNGGFAIFSLSGSGADLTLTPVPGAPRIEAGLARGPGYALDLSASPRLLAAATAASTRLYDVDAPDAPVLLSTVPTTPTTPPTPTTVALRWPLLWTARRGTNVPPELWHVADPANPVLIPTTTWTDLGSEYNSYDCTRAQSASFSPDGSALYTARWSTLQLLAVDCTP